jgi:hypothetical protein
VEDADRLHKDAVASRVPEGLEEAGERFVGLFLTVALLDHVAKEVIATRVDVDHATK